MSDNLEHENPDEINDEEADDSTSRRRIKKTDSKEKDGTDIQIPSAEKASELNPNGHRHALPGNKLKNECAKNNELRGGVKIEPKKKRDGRRPTKTQTPNNGTPKEGGAQNIQQSNIMPVAAQSDEPEFKNLLTDTEKKSNEKEDDPTKDT